MVSIGTVTRMSVIMTSRDDGPVSLKLEVWDAAACREVERREINIDPTLPGKPGRIQRCVGTDTRRELTTNYDSEQRKSWISGSKCIEHDTSPTTDNHGTKKWCPTLPYEILNHAVPSHDNSTCYCGTCEKYRNDERQYRVNEVD